MNNPGLITLLLATAILAACGENSTAPAAPPPQATIAVPDVPAVPLPPLPSPTAADTAATATDSAAPDPKGTLTKEQEANSMPMAGHGNNHSSPSLGTSQSK